MRRVRQRLLWLTPCCLLGAGCGRDYDEAERVVARGPVPLKECRFEDAPASGAGWSYDRRSGGMLDDRHLLVGAALHAFTLRRSPDVAVVHTTPDGVEHELATWAPGPTASTGFDAITFKGAVIVLLAIDRTLVQMVGLPAGWPELELSPPVAIRSSPGLPVARPCLASSGTRLHAIWSEGGPRGPVNLLYASTEDPQGEWSAPRSLCETANWATAGIAADGDDVYVGWSDRRFVQNRLFREDNEAKAFVVRSTDGGRSFGRPVLLDDRADRRVYTAGIRLAVAGDDLILLADDGQEPPDFVGARLARDLSTWTVLGPVSREDLQSAQDRRLRERHAAAAAPRRRSGVVTWYDSD